MWPLAVLLPVTRPWDSVTLAHGTPPQLGFATPAPTGWHCTRVQEQVSRVLYFSCKDFGVRPQWPKVGLHSRETGLETGGAGGGRTSAARRRAPLHPLRVRTSCSSGQCAAATFAGCVVSPAFADGEETEFRVPLW